MGLLTKQDILKADDLEVREVECPEWGGTVRVRAITGAQRDEFEASLVTRDGRKMKPNMANVRAKMVALCMVDATGARMWSEAEVQLLGGKSAVALDRVFTVCQQLAGLAASDVEELTKNSAPDPGDSLPLTSAHSLDALTLTNLVRA